MWDKVGEKLGILYGTDQADKLVRELKSLVSSEKASQKYIPSNKDVALITYADSVVSPSQKSLNTLQEFALESGLTQAFNSIHILPFYPWDTDRGFSVMDYYKVADAYGGWDDIKNLGKDFRLMFDFVANHASIENPLVQNSLIAGHLTEKDRWFKNYEYYRDFVITYNDENKPSDEDLKNLARPRPTPVLSKYYVLENENGYKAYLGEPAINKKIIGSGYVWTTFSRPDNPDGSVATRQVDLNFRNPRVFLETLKILLFYIRQSAKLIRLDAIGYIWKKPGSTSLHEKEAHLILEVIHEILAATHPEVITISEVNEQQEKVFEYLGAEGHEESDFVYQFSHFPLALYAVLTGNAEPYKKWLKTTEMFAGRQFITVLGSHDGLGLKPARGLLPDEEIQKLTNILVNEHGGLPNYAILPGGAKIVYEVCSTPWNLVNKPGSSEDFSLRLKKYLSILSLGICVRGIPGIYFNGLVGADNYRPEKGLDENRTVNRENFDFGALMKEINDPQSQKFQVLQNVKKYLEIRSSEPAFDPFADKTEILETVPGVMAQVLRGKEAKETIVAVNNLSPEKQTVVLKFNNMPETNWFDLISGKTFDNIKSVNLEPYETVWLKKS